MALSLYEEDGRFRVYDEETGGFSSDAERIEDLMKALPKNRQIRLYISMDAFSIRKSVLPHMESEKIREILPYEMEGFFLSPSSGLLLDFCPIRPAEKGIEGLVFALNRKTAEGHTAPFVKAGLNLISLTPAWDNRLLEYGVDKDLFHKAALNLAPAGLFREKKKRKTRDAYRTAFFYMASFLLIFLAGLAVRHFLVVKKEAGMKKEVSALYAGLFPDQKMPPDLYYGLQAKLAELKQNYRAVKGMDVLGLLKSVSESSNDKVRVKEISMEGSKATLKGEGEDYASVGQFRDNLNKAFAEVQLIETKKMQDGRSGFVIEVTVNE